jgi:sterol desaturase/sphingolipid hydroxylase (fatty acid hydroxylase superfamily)
MDILTQEPLIRVGSFIFIFAAMAFAEVRSPRRSLSVSKRGRWFANLALTFINALILRVLIPVVPVGMALICSEKGWGLLNAYPVPYGAALVFGVIFLDFVIYLQHVLFHNIPLFWYIHRMHHTDLDVDVTTGFRFHPLEILLSLGIKLAAVAAFGPPAAAVLLFEVLLNGTSMFNHSNLLLPEKLDRLLRLVVVTPDMHRVHHSVIIRETNSNYGFNLPWWDRLLKTYRPQPAKGHEGMVIGLARFRKPEELILGKLLKMPFSGRY